MLKPGDAHPCYGCSSFVDNIGHLEHLASRDANFVLTSPATIEEIKSVKEKMGWSVPWYSSSGKGWEDDCGAGQEFGISVFVRDDDGSVYRTYYTTKRGSDRIRWVFRAADIFGR